MLWELLVVRPGAPGLFIPMGAQWCRDPLRGAMDVPSRSGSAAPSRKVGSTPGCDIAPPRRSLACDIISREAF